MLLGKRWLVPALVGGAALAYAYHRGTAHGHADGERHERSHGHADGERHERSDGHGHGRQRYSARNATLYDAVTAPVLGGFFTWAAQDLAALAPRARVLEVGSGPGRLAAKLAALAPEVQVTGVDIAPEMVARANALAARSGVADRVAFRVGDVAALPFPDASFDVVVSTFSLHHWSNPAGAWRRSTACCAQAASLGSTTWSTGSGGSSREGRASRS